MPTLVKFDGEYSNNDVNKKVTSYCIDSEFCNIFYGGTAVFMNSFDGIEKQFKDVQDAYGKHERPIEHFIISFNDDSSKRFTFTKYDANDFALCISKYIGTSFQNIFAVHEGSEGEIFSLSAPSVSYKYKDNLHVHFVINRVSYMNGKMFYGNNLDYWNIINFAKNEIPILLKYEGYKDLEWKFKYKKVDYKPRNR